MERPGREALERLTRPPLSEVFAALGSGPEGLSSGEAEVRLRRTGPNAIPGSRGPSPARQLLEQMIHLFALLPWVAAILVFVGGMPQLGWAIIAVVIINGVFSFAQEYRAERATIPAQGYGPQQIADMEATITTTDAVVVVIATPIDLRHLIRIAKPAVRVTYCFRRSRDRRRWPMP